MRSLPSLLSFLAFATSVGAQDPRDAALPPARSTDSAPMQPYTAAIPGSDVTFDMVPIPGGRFKIGSPGTEKGHQPDEEPAHDVDIEPFWMGKTEVTWDEYTLFMFPKKDTKVREAKGLDPAGYAAADAVARPTEPYPDFSFGMAREGCPAISMTQHAANKYCEWLSARTGQFFRLPTEAEWEYTARAGTTTAYFWGDSPDRIDEYCWYGKNSDFKYQKVGTKKPNPWGLYDILGHVAEWTLDQYDPHYYGNSPTETPWNKVTKPYPHAVRGGSWDDDDVTKLRCAARRGSSRDWKTQDPGNPKSIWYHIDATFVGFRVIRPLKVPSAAEMKAYWNSGVEKD